MNKKWQSLLYLALIAVLLFGGWFTYKKLSSRVIPGQTKAGSQEMSQEISETDKTEEQPASQESMKEEVSLKDPAPDFRVMDQEGKAFRFSDYRGKPVIINFWASWCPPCVSELPGFEQAFKTYGDRIIFMMVNLTDGVRETENIVREFLQENGYSFPVFYDKDGSAAETYQIYAIPLTVFINEKGEIIHKQSGAMSEYALNSFIEELLR